MKPCAAFDFTMFRNMQNGFAKYACLIFISVALLLWQPLKAQEPGSPDDLHASLVVIFHHTFEEADVTQDAHDTLFDIIDKAVNVYKQNETDEAYSLIEENFKKFCNKIWDARVLPKDPDDPREKAEINNDCINKARAALRPLWPFC